MLSRACWTYISMKMLWLYNSSSFNNLFSASFFSAVSELDMQVQTISESWSWSLNHWMSDASISACPWECFPHCMLFWVSDASKGIHQFQQFSVTSITTYLLTVSIELSIISWNGPSSDPSPLLLLHKTPSILLCYPLFSWSPWKRTLFSQIAIVWVVDGIWPNANFG